MSRSAALWLCLAACTPSGDDTGGGDDTDEGTCTALVTIAFYSDGQCAIEVGRRTYVTGDSCFSWTASGSGAEDNSATRFQCYDDRLCYTQHAGTLTCEDGLVEPTDKEAKNGVCLDEPAGSLYSMLIGGNEDCPPPPEGFECPSSLAEEGTDGIEECTSGN